MIYLWAFIIGGAICVLAQIMYDYTKLTPAHVLVLLTVSGAVLEGMGLYGPLLNPGWRRFSSRHGFGASVTVA